MMNIEIRRAQAEDCETAFVLTKELIEYHDMLDIFELTQSRLKELISQGEIISLIAYADGEPAGILNCFCRLYTTFTGRSILYIEDLYSRESYRGCGIGKKLFEKAKDIAAENDCEKIELKCADWNVKSAGFYKALGMKPDKDWVTYTLDRSQF